MSVLAGMASHNVGVAGSSEGGYVKAEKSMMLGPRFGLEGDPKTVKVVRGPVGEVSLIVADVWLR